MRTRDFQLIGLAAVLAVWMGGVGFAQPEPTLAEPIPMGAPPVVPLPQSGDVLPGVPPGAETAPAPDLPAGAVPAEEDGYVPLEQGPVHEAYAEHFTLDAPEPYVVNREPPAQVEELPPDLAPEGAIWIPGYWMWMEDHEDFVWVSGVWRVPPRDENGFLVIGVR